MKPDPLDEPKPDDFAFVVTGCLGVILTLFGARALWIAFSGGQFYGNVGRAMSFIARLGLSAAIILSGLVLLIITVWGLRRNRRANDGN